MIRRRHGERDLHGARIWRRRGSFQYTSRRSRGRRAPILFEDAERLFPVAPRQQWLAAGVLDFRAGFQRAPDPLLLPGLARRVERVAPARPGLSSPARRPRARVASNRSGRCAKSRWLGAPRAIELRRSSATLRTRRAPHQYALKPRLGRIHAAPERVVGRGARLVLARPPPVPLRPRAPLETVELRARLPTAAACAARPASRCSARAREPAEIRSVFARFKSALMHGQATARAPPMSTAASKCSMAPAMSPPTLSSPARLSCNVASIPASPARSAAARPRS